MKNLRIISWLILIHTTLIAFEVNTHQGITRCALTQECSESGGVLNLKNFVNNTELNNEKVLYTNEIFEKYNKTYKFYVEEQNKTGFNDWNITIRSTNYQGMIEAGVVLEDSLYHNGAFEGDGRYNNHFYASQIEDTRIGCREIFIPIGRALQISGFPLSGTVAIGNVELMKTPKALCGGIGLRTDNIDWVFNEEVNLGFNRINDYGLEDAFEYMKKSFEGNETSRRKYQAKFFVSLGMMSHMLQDLHSPAHVRDGSHAKGDYIEIYGRYDGGFNLSNGERNPYNEPEIEEAIRTFDMHSYLNGMNFKSLEEIYYKEASWISNNFFSDSHNAFETAHTQTGMGVKFNNIFDKDTIFDEYNTHLSVNETREVPFSNEEDSSWNYILSGGNSVPEIYGDISAFEYSIFAFVQKGFFSTFDFSSEHLFDNEHMIKPIYRLENDGEDNYELITDTGYQTSDKTPLKHTAVHVIPRAVASTQAMLGFFFRGQIKASTVYDRAIWVFNVSDTTDVSDTSLLTLKAGGKFYFYYMNDDNISKPIAIEENGDAKPYILEEDFLVNSSKIFILNNIVSPPSDDIFAGKNIDGETRWIVMYEGDIGEDLGGSNNFGYGMKGISVDIALDRFTRGETNETVIDYANNLHWQDSEITWQDSWYGANRYCNNLVLAGYDDWSLPVSSQLLSIVKPHGDSYIYEKNFKHLGEVGYWSLNFHDNYPLANTATVISFNGGFSVEIEVNYHMNTRCVRSTY